MLNRLFSNIGAGILGLWLSQRFISGVELKVIPGESSFLGFSFTANWQILILCGLILGLINLFIKPILNLITLPLKALTFGLFGLVINIAIIFGLDILFKELTISGIAPLFWTTIIVLITTNILSLFYPK